MYTCERFIAFIDILGFKNIVKNYNGNLDSLGNEMSEIFQSSIKSSLDGKNVYVKDNHNLNSDDNIKVYQFSDSIVLYTKDDSRESLEKIILVLNLLLAQSMQRGFPLRGALTKGELFVNLPIIVGQSFINAYKLENLQEWSGMIVEECCFDLYEDLRKKLILDKKIVTYPVPMKNCGKRMQDGIKYEKHYVINWPQFIGCTMVSILNLKDKFSINIGEPIKEEEIGKKNETFKFLKDNIGFDYKLPSFIHDIEIYGR